ncbi:hypothetical protein V1478_014555 [Vespula squamosa]|uniref:Uncharacterized protein n=1 Tax=Vespula squamosa TaxID=30214 RepID=A0ABD2A8B5_VESSQ
MYRRDMCTSSRTFYVRPNSRIDHNHSSSFLTFFENELETFNIDKNNTRIVFHCTQCNNKHSGNNCEITLDD